MMKEISHEIILKWGKYKGVSLPVQQKESAIILYRFMLRLRRFQEEIIKEYHLANEMRCPVHFCIGQEAVSAALSVSIKKDDFLFSPHRSHGYFLAKGGAFKPLLAEIYGKQTGTNGGMAGSQEISLPSINFYSGAILSGLLAIGVGSALGFQLKKSNQVSVACFGDGAIDEGIFWEAVSYAQLCKLPIIFICENNRYSTYSPQLNRQPADDIHKRVASFGLKSEAVFGNDVLSVSSVLNKAFNHARSGKGPFFVEAYTYRWFGHVGPEDDDYVGYRPVRELEFWKKNCPLLLLEKAMMRKKIINKQLKEKMLKEINSEIKEAFDFAKKSPYPVEMVWEDQNYSSDSPVADKLLKDFADMANFDHSQEETKPEPY